MDFKALKRICSGLNQNVVILNMIKIFRLHAGLNQFNLERNEKCEKEKKKKEK